ncbi:hypothetical protein NQ315_004516 [Exocentrus adspersus]|uniref:RNase H type-1 domain-containing protein n=1 Tax=Exocentrus adspersus TaxID=1586481 RepID=A0AAV8VPP4_9CUCU|nr:hypothetical protein NQ315_004516 [Exocentrus adspersus]
MVYSTSALRAEKEVPMFAMNVIEAKDRLGLSGNYSTTFLSTKLLVDLIRHSSSVSQAEVLAVLMVAHRNDVKNSKEGKILVCSDSQKALRAINSPRTRSTLVQECGDALESLARQKQVELVWVPGSMGIQGNERANQLTCLGSGPSCQGPQPIFGISRGSIDGSLSKWAYQRLGMSWRTNTGCREAHNFLDEPDSSKWWGS